MTAPTPCRACGTPTPREICDACFEEACFERDHVPPEHKRCSKCRKIKSRVTFGRNAAQRDGLQSYCKACVRTKRKR